MSNPKSSNHGPFAKKLLPILTNTMHATAPFISVFVGVHIAAPIAACLGGSSASSNVMLLGREYYQTPFAERYLVLLPLSIHALSGIGKRILSPPNQPPRPANSLLTQTAYASMLLVGIHYFIHRIAPSNPLPPISSLGPSELDYEFVKTGLIKYPIRSWILYSGLVTGVLLHAAEGNRTLWNRYAAPTFGRITQLARKLRTAAITLGIVPVLSGLYFISSEPLYVFGPLSERINALYDSIWIYRF